MAFDHREGAAANNPYAAVMGRTFVDLDEAGPISILDAARATTLSSWVGRVIPGAEDWPSAGELDTVAYIDAVIRKAPPLRPVVISGIDAVEKAASRTHNTPFASLGAAEQDAILRDAEKTTAPEAFSVVLELTYEAYYRSPLVQEVVKRRTGFDMRNTIVGKPMSAFPTERLEGIAKRPDHYRSVVA